MRIIIASDLHGSISSLNFLIEKTREIQPDMLVLLGDLVYHGPRNPLPQGYDTLSILEEMPDLAKIETPITAVRGNCDAEVDVAQMPFPMPDTAWLMINNQRVMACHGHRLPADPPFHGISKGMTILRGHTHIPRCETIDGINIWNPGSLSLPKGGYPRSYAIWDEEIFKILDMNGNEIMRHRPE